MPGRTPKDPSLLARRNKVTTKATLSLVTDVEAPALPDRIDEEGQPVTWHQMAVDFWDEVWTSPMAAEYLDADVPGLFILAALTDAYWKGLEAGRVGKELAAEIRLQRIDYGLTPIARRRLQWEVERAEEVVDKGRRRRLTQPPTGRPSEPTSASDDDDDRLALVE